MELTVLDRLNLLNILPKEGDITTLKIVRKLREDLSFSDEEHKKLQFKQEGEALYWQANDLVKEVNFGEKATDLIKESFRRLDKDRKLREEYLDLYEKFVGE